MSGGNPIAQQASMDLADDSIELGQADRGELLSPQEGPDTQEPLLVDSRIDNNHATAKRRAPMFSALIILVGVLGSTAFFSMGIVSLRREQDAFFERRATDITKSIEAAWRQYEVFGLWMQESCFSPLNETSQDTASGRLGLCSREKFSMLTESMSSIGLDFQAVGMIPQVTRDGRASLEEDSRLYHAKHNPDIDYNGFVGYHPDNESGGFAIGPMQEEPIYWPVHYIEPVNGNEAAVDLDLYSHPARRTAIDKLVSEWRPVVTGRIRLAQETEPNGKCML